MPTNSPVWGTPIPAAGDSNNIPGDLAKISAVLDLVGTPRFANVSARTAAINTAISNLGLTAIPRGLPSWVDANGYPEYYDGTIWRPNAKTRIARINPAATSATITGGTTGATAVGNIPQYAFPVCVDIRWGLGATQATAADTWDGVLWLNGSASVLPGAAGRGSGSWDTATGSVRWDRAANDAAATFQLIFQRASGSSSASTILDNRYTYCEAFVEAL